MSDEMLSQEEIEALLRARRWEIKTTTLMLQQMKK